MTGSACRSAFRYEAARNVSCREKRDDIEELGEGFGEGKGTGVRSDGAVGGFLKLMVFHWFYKVFRSLGGSQDGPQHRPKLDLVLGGSWERLGSVLGGPRRAKMEPRWANLAPRWLQDGHPT